MGDDHGVKGVRSGLTASDVSAARQLMQLTASLEDTKEGNNMKEGKWKEMIKRKVWQQEEVPSGSDEGEVLYRPQKRKFRPLADIYDKTEPVSIEEAEGRGWR